MANINNNILKISNLDIGFKSKKETRTIVSNLNFSVNNGELVSVIGKNGIGKSTLLRTLSSVQQPLAGHVFINGKNSTTFSQKERSKHISFVHTEQLPKSQLTVFEIVALGRQPFTNWIDQLQETDINTVKKALEDTEILHLQHHNFHQLSDGQLQRVLIARALAQDTPLIVLDEPTAHLDLHQTLKISTLLKRLTIKTKKTILISTHEINLALKLSDTLLVLKDNSYNYGSVDALVALNAFDTLFPNKLLKFDKSLKQFIIKDF